ncbi:hypothetical protein [Kutzneria sp. 744]|uniref:hypothetical protein n=1 Tax=Kutzneria sp. (strain 744) TaxID=345341 RepID=UPI0018DD37E7|nr:hypothetical protein [Kutzneria sp. 744]
MSSMTRFGTRAAVLLVGGLLVTAGTTGAQSASAAATASGVTATVNADGSYQIHTQQPADWTFNGSVGHALTSRSSTTGRDAVGEFQQVTFGYTDGVPRSGSIRVYQNVPVVVFGATNQTAAANSSAAAFPALTTPSLPYRESFQHAPFAPYQFNGSLAADSPLLNFDSHNNGFLVSPADNFAVSNMTRGANTVSDGIASGVATLPAGFTHRTILVVGQGVNSTFATWGSALMALGGKHPIPNDANATLDKLGYWTDNGASYYYKYDTSKGYAGTLAAVTKDFAAHGVPLGYLQLDSWWYPKGSSNTWQGNGTDRGGEYTYQAAPELFPSGLAAFHQQVGLPLVTHARWIDSASPYRRQYQMSGNVVTDPKFWNSTMNYLSAAGVTAFEQDWLGQDAQPKYNLTDPNAFMDGMGNAAAANNVAMQYCMALPWNTLQSTLYQNLQTTRVSQDRFERSKWDSFLFDSRLASALGEWPWTDVFMSTETTNLLLATLSGGMVGVGDAIGKENAANLLRSVRADGVIVKPDVPIVPVDSVYTATAQGGTPPMVAETHTDHDGLRDGYFFAYARNGGSQSISFRPDDQGIAGPSYVYNYLTGAGKLVPAAGTYTDTVNADGSYYVVAPVGSSGIALLGDAGKFVSLGSKRISQLSDDGTVHTRVTFATNEKSVTLHGYAPSAPRATATDGTVGAVHYDTTTHLFTATVTPGSDHDAAVSFAGH